MQLYTHLFCFHSISALSVKDFTQWNALLNYIIVSFLTKPYAAKFFILKNLHMQIELSFKRKRWKFHGSPLVWENSCKNSQMLRIPFGSFILNLQFYCKLFPPNPQLFLLSPLLPPQPRANTLFNYGIILQYQHTFLRFWRLNNQFSAVDFLPPSLNRSQKLFLCWWSHHPPNIINPFS